MRKVVLLLTFFLAANIHSQSASSFSSKMDKLFEDEFFEYSMASVLIYDLDADTAIYARQPKMLLHPASNMKVLTTAAALVYLGPAYDFETKVLYTGEINGGTLNGNLFFKGGGDPDFTSSDLNDLIDSVKAAGIKKIEGNVYGDVTMMDSLFWGKGWMWDDDPYTDFPYLTPLVINDASVQIVYSPGEVGEPVEARIKPQTDYFNILNTSETTLSLPKNGLRFEVTRNWLQRENDVIIRGNYAVLNGIDSTSINIVNPEMYFMYLARERLEQVGIEVTGSTGIAAAPDGAKSLGAEKRSFYQVINNLNKYSDNLSAEMTLRALGASRFDTPVGAEEGIEMIDSLILASGLSPYDYNLVDGSGVSHYNLVNAELLVEVLEYMYDNHPDMYELLYNSFPVGGIDGTLRYRMKNKLVYGNVHAKTGTLHGVSALSGYLTARNNHKLAFAILVQNYNGSSYKARSIQDKITEIAAGYR